MAARSRKSKEPTTPGPIPISAACTFLPILEFFLNLGAPVDRWLEECRLPYQIYEDSEAYVPTKNYWHFVSLAATKEGVDDLGLRVAHDHIYDINGLSVVASTFAEPTLLAGIERYSLAIRGVYSGMHVVLVRGENDTVKLVLKKTFGTEVPGFTQTEWLGISSLISVVQLFAGRTWQPEVISLKTTRVVPPLAQALYPNAHIMRGQQTTHISFPKQILSLGPSSFGGEVVARLRSASAVLRPAEAPADLAESLLRLLASYLPDGYLSLEAVAEITGMSPRTMQRRLAIDGLDFSWLVERTRFDVASRMLVNTDASSLEIAYATGYEDPSHFARGFKRIAGCSPREYRRVHKDETRG